jgi:Tol biopolymer transport system component
MIPITGGPATKINLPEPVDTAWVLKWASDGKSVVYPKNENGVENLWSFRLDGGKPTKLTEFASDTIFSFDVSHDNRLVVSRGDVLHDLVLLENPK